jgi:hypothetical protein
VKLELDIALVSAAKAGRYTIHRTLALGRGEKGTVSTGEQLLARVKGLPSPEQALLPPSSAAQSQGREIEARSRRARRADRRQGPREIRE